MNADVIHMPHYSMPMRPGRPTVVLTVHDVTFFTEPEHHTAVSGMFFKIGDPHRYQARHADHRAV